MTTTTVSKVVAQSHTENERAVLRKWCDEAANAGGSFSITACHDREQGHCITYVINWPKEIVLTALAQPGGAG